MPVHPPAGLLPCIIHDGSLQISPKYILVKRNSLGNGADSYWSPPAHSFLTRPPIGRHFSPAQPSDCLAIDFPGRAISPGEDLLFPPLRDHTFSPKGRHTVLHCAHRASTLKWSLQACQRFPLEGGLFDLPLRATFSPSHPLAHRDVPLTQASAFSGRALREHRRPTGCPPSPLFEQPLHPCLNLIQPLAQVGLKHISFGLHDHALGLDLILKQHQLGKQLLLL
jgi:hypothetical protein